MFKNNDWVKNLLKNLSLNNLIKISSNESYIKSLQKYLVKILSKKEKREDKEKENK